MSFRSEQGFVRSVVYPFSQALIFVMITACGKIDGPLVLNRPGKGVLPVTSKVELSLETTEITLSEGGAATLSVTLSEKRTVPTVASVSLYSERGDEASDFLPIANTVTIPANRFTATLAVSVADDLIYEGVEKFELRIASSDAAIDVMTDKVIITVNDDEPIPEVSFANPSQTVQEGSVAQSIAVEISPVSQFETTVTYTVSDLTATNGADYSLGSGVITFSPGDTSTTVSFNTSTDADLEGNETFQVTLGTITTGTATVSSTQKTHMVTIEDDDIEAFSITGVTSDSESDLDAILNGSLSPTINWGTSNGAASYDVTVYANDGTTVVCPTANTALLTHEFASCSLAGNTDYKAKVVAKHANGITTLAASNDMFDFYVNAAPTAVDDGPYLVMASEGVVSFNVLADNTATGANDPDGDPDGQGLTVIAVSTGAKGLSAFTASTVTFDPTATESGVETLTYTVSDGRGGTATATLTIHIMTPHTWTGVAGTTTWATASNWCGSVAATRLSCVGGGAVPGASDKAIFDGTCQSNCSAAMADGATIELAGLLLDTGYSGTLTQGTGTVIDVGSSYYVQRSGIFQGATGNITFDKFYLEGGEFRSTSNNLHIGFLKSVGGATSNEVDGFKVGAGASFVHRSGRVVFDGIARGNCSQQVPTTVILNKDTEFWDVELKAAQELQGCFSTYSADVSRIPITGAGRFIILNDFYHKDGTFQDNSPELRGDLYVSCVADALNSECAEAGGTLIMNGSGTQYYSGDANGNAGRIIVQKTSGTVEPASTDFRLVGLEIQSGTFKAPAGSLYFQTASSTSLVVCLTMPESGATFLHNYGTVVFANTGANNRPNEIDVNIDPQLYNVTVDITGTAAGNNYRGFLGAQSKTVSILGDLTIRNGGLTGGTFQVYGDINLLCPDPVNYVCAEGEQGNTTIELVGSNTQTISMEPGVLQPGSRWNVKKDNPTDQVLFATDAIMTTHGSFSVSMGTLNLGDYNLTIDGKLRIYNGGLVTCNSGVGSLTATQIENLAGAGGLSCP